MIDDIHIAPYRAGGHGPKSGSKSAEGTLLIDATLKAPMPPLALPAEPYMVRARQIWEELQLPAPDAAAAMARLLARRLERCLEPVRGCHRCRRLAQEWREHACPPPGRHETGNPRSRHRTGLTRIWGRTEPETVRPRNFGWPCSCLLTLFDHAETWAARISIPKMARRSPVPHPPGPDGRKPL